MVIITRTSKNETITDAVKRIYEGLIKLNSLKPYPDVNLHFEELVDLSLRKEGNVEDTLQQLKQRGVDIKNLWKICGEGEIELEYFWAEKILYSGASLHDFPYYSNYDRLTDFELGAIRRHRNLVGRTMLYVGNGALPFTALMYSSKEKGLSVDCLDRDLKSRELGAKIYEHAGAKGSFNLGDIANTDLQLEKYDILFICALVGSNNEEKNAWLERIHPRLDKGSLVVVRSVPDDHRKLLYPQFTFSPENTTRYVRLGEYIPPREIRVINSVKLAEPR